MNVRQVLGSLLKEEATYWSSTTCSVRYMADTEAWAELADIYIESEMYVQAAFCMEELIATAPHNYVNHLRYAEVLCRLTSPSCVLPCCYLDLFIIYCAPMRAGWSLWIVWDTF